MGFGPDMSIKDDFDLRTSKGRKLLIKRLWQYRWVYLIMVIPTMSLIILFRYMPLPGIALAFMSFRPVYAKPFVYEGPELFRWFATLLHTLQPKILFNYLGSSEFVGLEHFSRLLEESNFRKAFLNTIIISLMKLAIGFPFPILLTLLINEVYSKKYKRVLQTVFTFPRFLSWVVLAGIILNILGDTGAVKKFMVTIYPELQNTWNILYNPDYFRLGLVLSDMWKEGGWGTILYLGAIAGLDPALFEAATIDGCNRFKKIVHVTMPGIAPIIIIMFLLNVGNIVNANFDQVFNLYSPSTFSTGDVIDTYIYRMSFQSSTVQDFGFTTAVSLFKNLINFTLLISANTMARKLGQEGII
jgi:putative aldouronate transport system permease protein